jgi:hypothetical protein
MHGGAVAAVVLGAAELLVRAEAAQEVLADAVV